MRGLFLAMILGCASSGAAAAECVVSYEEFEGAIPHLDLLDCPDGKPSADEGFCRLVVDGEEAFVYAFRFTDDGDACLADVREEDLEDFLYQE